MGLMSGIDVIVVKNKYTGVMRYAEVAIKTLFIRIRTQPNIYLLTFRGYEMLVPVRMLTIGRPLIYDEFIHPIEWLAYEHSKIKPNGLFMRAFIVFYRAITQSTQLLLTDTESHANLSATITGLQRNKIVNVPVGTDESVFVYKKNKKSHNRIFTAFYYGNMLPLHGLEYVVEAAIILKDEPIEFVLVGGGKNSVKLVERAKTRGANITHKHWVNFLELPKLMAVADVCLAGPFGATFQSRYVITGKAYQYLAMGRPTLVGENYESHVFTDKVNALVVPMADSKMLADALRWARKNRDLLDAIGLAGRRLYEKNYSNHVLSEKLQQALVTANLLESSTSTKK